MKFISSQPLFFIHSFNTNRIVVLLVFGSDSMFTVP